MGCLVGCHRLATLEARVASIEDRVSSIEATLDEVVERAEAHHIRLRHMDQRLAEHCRVTSGIRRELACDEA